MKKFLLATTCLALASTASMAADMGMPYTKAPMAAPTAFSWTGCYAGAHVGGGNLTTNGNNGIGNNGVFGNDGFLTANQNGAGAVAGGQLGCNYQDGNWVMGLEGEGYWSGIKASQIQPFTEGGPSSNTFTMKNTSDFTIAARAGMAFDRTLVYGKVGWAWGNYKLSGAENVPGETFSNNSSGTLNGFMVGAGLEHALTRNWTIKAEYDFIGYGTKSLTNNFCDNGVCTPATGSSASNSISSNKQVVKVGFNYLFGPGH